MELCLSLPLNLMPMVLRQMLLWEGTNVVDSLARNTVYMKCIVFRPHFRDCTEEQRRSPDGLPRIERVPQAD